MIPKSANVRATNCFEPRIPFPGEIPSHGRTPTATATDSKSEAEGREFQSIPPLSRQTLQPADRTESYQPQNQNPLLFFCPALLSFFVNPCQGLKAPSPDGLRSASRMPYKAQMGKNSRHCRYTLCLCASAPRCLQISASVDGRFSLWNHLSVPGTCTDPFEIRKCSTFASCSGNSG